MLTQTKKTMANLPIGRISGTFGIRGELKCDPSHAGRTLFVRGARLTLERDGASEVVELEEVREHKGRLLVRFKGVDTTNDAATYCGGVFFAPRGELDVGAGEYLDIDLVGCDVVDAKGVSRGRVSAVAHYPASDMLIVAGRMLPMVRAFIRSIDVAARRIAVDIPPGLLDDGAESDGGS
jgi:16S rRNA processing protein RimM